MKGDLQRERKSFSSVGQPEHLDNGENSSTQARECLPNTGWIREMSLKEKPEVLAAQVSGTGVHVRKAITGRGVFPQLIKEISSSVGEEVRTGIWGKKHVMRQQNLENIYLPINTAQRRKSVKILVESMVSRLKTHFPCP